MIHQIFLPARDWFKRITLTNIPQPKLGYIKVIELSGVQFGLKSYAWFQNRSSAQREFDLKSQVWFQSFGNKSSKICHMILFVYHFPAIWLVTLNKPWNLIGCFVFSVACSLAGKKMWFKAKMVRFMNKLHQLEPITLHGPPVISKWV